MRVRRSRRFSLEGLPVREGGMQPWSVLQHKRGRSLSSGQGGEGSGWTSLFLTGVDERRKANSQ